MAEGIFPKEGVNGTIDLEAFLGSKQPWGLSSYFANSILVATLSTVLSYQMTAIFFNLTQGFKPPCETTSAAIHSRILAMNPSPLAITDSVFRREFVTSIRLPQTAGKGSLPQGQNTASTKNVLILFVLVLIAPVFNLLTIVLTTEAEESLDLSAVGGFALGLSASKVELGSAEIFGSCYTYPVVTPLSFSSHVDFVRCQDSYRVETIPSIGASNSFLELTVSRWASVKVEYLHPVRGFANETLKNTFEFFGTVRTELGLFRIGHDIEINTIRSLFNRALLGNAFPEVEEASEISAANGELKFTYHHAAESEALADVYGLLGAVLYGELYSRLTLVRSDNLLLMREEDVIKGNEDIKFTETSDIPFIRWRGKILSESRLIVAVLVAVLVRIATICLTRNDVESGIECLLKSFLGMPMDSQLLWKNDTVTYNNLYVVDNITLYGVERKHLDEFRH